MSVPYTTIIRKLNEQVTLAKRSIEDEKLLKHHISQVKLLCDLILEETKVKHANQPSTMKDSELHKIESLSLKQTPETIDASGDSIFDF